MVLMEVVVERAYWSDWRWSELSLWERCLVSLWTDVARYAEQSWDIELDDDNYRAAIRSDRQLVEQRV